ncbi:MAG: hypothetical protein ACI9W4_001928 [Rhodothermales bacterium]|jgi:hypothetical protein
MAKPDKSARSIPFLKEGYALAQVLAPDQETARQMTVEAFQKTAGASRFALLEALLVGVDIPAPRLVPVTPPNVLWETTSGFRTPSVSTGPPLAVAHSSLIADRLAAEHRGQDILGRFAGLPTEARAVSYLGLVKELGTADLASLFRVSPGHMASIQADAASTLFGHSTRPGDSALLGTSLDPLLELPEGPLKKSVRKAMTVSLKASRSGGPRSAPRGRLLPVLGILMLSVVAALAVTRMFPRTSAGPVVQETTDALDAAVAHLPQESPQISSSDPVEIEAWMNQRIPWRFTVPAVEGLPLAGAGFARLASGIRIPALYYGAGETDLAIGVMNYAILQASSDRLMLDRPTIDILASGETPVQRTIDGHSALAMRHRDDIYLAVSRQIDVSLASRITFGVE